MITPNEDPKDKEINSSIEHWKEDFKSERVKPK